MAHRSIEFTLLDVSMKNCLYELNYQYDNNILLDEALNIGEWKNFKDPSNNHVFNHWYYKSIDNRYAKEIVDYFSNKIDVDIRARFFYQKSNWTLPFHKDRGTQCSINFILNDTNDKVSFRDGDFSYKCALLNLQKEHAVVNPKSDRIMMKLSIFDKPYNEVLKCITA